jgi:single-strand DNA-binding protein
VDRSDRGAAAALRANDGACGLFGGVTAPEDVIDDIFTLRSVPNLQALPASPSRIAAHVMRCEVRSGRGHQALWRTSARARKALDTEELIYTAKGKQVVRFVVLVNQRKQDAETGEWTDGEPARHSCVAFGTLGEHIADSLGKGDRVLVLGRVTTDGWSDKDTGEKRTAQRILIDAAGPSLRWATARVQKAQRISTSRTDDEVE